MVYDYSKLEGKIIEKFGTRERFAKALGITTKTISEKLNNATVAVAASGMLSVHESCPVCTPDPDVVLVHTPKPDAPLSK